MRLSQKRDYGFLDAAFTKRDYSFLDAALTKKRQRFS